MTFYRLLTLIVIAFCSSVLTRGPQAQVYPSWVYKYKLEMSYSSCKRGELYSHICINLGDGLLKKDPKAAKEAYSIGCHWWEDSRACQKLKILAAAPTKKAKQLPATLIAPPKAKAKKKVVTKAPKPKKVVQRVRKKTSSAKRKRPLKVPAPEPAMTSSQAKNAKTATQSIVFLCLVVLLGLPLVLTSRWVASLKRKSFKQNAENSYLKGEVVKLTGRLVSKVGGSKIESELPPIPTPEPEDNVLRFPRRGRIYK